MYYLSKKEAMTIAEIAVKTGTSVIPFVGTLLSCIIDEIKSKTMQKRQDEWMEIIENRLEQSVIDWNTIGNNENFTTAIIKATEIAAKTAEREKKEYLANAVANSIEFSADESILMIYMELLERYTVWHLQILAHFVNPEQGMGRGNENMGGADSPLYRRYPHMKERTDLVDKIIIDLQNEGTLTNGNYMYSSMSISGIYAKRTTKLGDEFLLFISAKE